MKSAFALIGAVVLGACATAVPERVNESALRILEAHERTGDTDTCMNLRSISQITAVNERTLLVKSGVSDYYVSDLKSRCSGVTTGFHRIEYTTSLSQLCRGEILRIVDNSSGMMTGSCAMGSFERLEPRAPAE